MAGWLSACTDSEIKTVEGQGQGHKVIAGALSADRYDCFGVPVCCVNKEHLKNVGPIRHSEPPHAALPFTRCRYCRVARRLRIDVHDDDDDDDNA